MLFKVFLGIHDMSKKKNFDLDVDINHKLISTKQYKKNAKGKFKMIINL